MIVRTCKICGKKFLCRFPSDPHQCCSKKCRNIARSISLKGRIITWGNKISKAKRGKKRPDMIGNTWRKGHTPWNKGKKLSDEIKRKISETLRQKYRSGELINPRKGVKATKEQIEKNRISHVIWFHNKSSEEKKLQLERLRRHKFPTTLEKKVLQLIDEYNLPFRYVGNGVLWINNKNPDFVSLDGKILIEVYCTYRHPKNYELLRRSALPQFHIIFLNEKDINRSGWKEHCLHIIKEKCNEVYKINQGTDQ